MAYPFLGVTCRVPSARRACGQFSTSASWHCPAGARAAGPPMSPPAQLSQPLSLTKAPKGWSRGDRDREVICPRWANTEQAIKRPPPWERHMRLSATWNLAAPGSWRPSSSWVCAPWQGPRNLVSACPWGTPRSCGGRGASGPASPGPCTPGGSGGPWPSAALPAPLTGTLFSPASGTRKGGMTS